MFCALCQGLFYLDKFGEAAVLCVCVYVLEWALINMDEYTSRRLWKPTCPIMFKDIPFITWESRNSQLSGNDLQHQCRLTFFFYWFCISLYIQERLMCVWMLMAWQCLCSMSKWPILCYFCLLLFLESECNISQFCQWAKTLNTQVDDKFLRPPLSCVVFISLWTRRRSMETLASAENDKSNQVVSLRSFGFF